MGRCDDGTMGGWDDGTNRQTIVHRIRQMIVHRGDVSSTTAISFTTETSRS